MFNTLTMEKMQVDLIGDVKMSEEMVSDEVEQRLRSLKLGRFTGEGTNGAGKNVSVELEPGRYLIDGTNGDGKKGVDELTQVEIETRLKQVTGSVCE